MNGIVRDGDEMKSQTSSGGKWHSSENTKYRKSLLKLKQQESLMERNLVNVTENMKLEPEVLRFVLHNTSDISRRRQILLDSVKKSLEEVAEDLKSAKSVTDCPEKIQNLDINAYRQRLVRLSQKIRDFKECSSDLQSLPREQTALESELHEFELNLHKYESATDSIESKSTSASSTSSRKENKRCHDYKEIQDFHALIAKTGHTDNWSDEDHLLFLKLRQKCSNIPALVAAIQVKCPDLTAEIIVNHVAWYKVYLSLREKQRSTIREWRERKEAEKTKKNSDGETMIEIPEGIPREKMHPDNAEKFPIGTANKCETRTTAKKTAGVVEVDSASRKKELIRRWKVERENKRSMDEERSKTLMESKLVAQEKRREERSKRIREALAEYRERKSTEVSSESSKNGSGAGRKYDPMLIKAFRKQDEEYTRKKKILIARLRRSAKNRTAKIVRTQIREMPGDSTLLNPTKVWSERCKVQELDTKEPKKLQYIKDVPHLYVQWRNKESMEIAESCSR